MKTLMIAILMLVSLSFGDVVSGTLHRSDAELVDDFMESIGVYDGRIKIVRVNNTVTYAVEFPREYFNINSDADVDRIASVFLSVGIVSAETSWHSDFAVCLFEDKTVIMFTQDCRTLVRMCEQDRSSAAIGDFSMNNIIIGDRAEADPVFNF